MAGLAGANGNDSVLDSDGDHTLQGAVGRENLYGYTGNDHILGGALRHIWPEPDRRHGGASGGGAS